MVKETENHGFIIPISILSSTGHGMKVQAAISENQNKFNKSATNCARPFKMACTPTFSWSRI